MSSFKDFDLDLKKVVSENKEEAEPKSLTPVLLTIAGKCSTMPNPTLTMTNPCCKNSNNVENDISPRCQ